MNLLLRDLTLLLVHFISGPSDLDLKMKFVYAEVYVQEVVRMPWDDSWLKTIRVKTLNYSQEDRGTFCAYVLINLDYNWDASYFLRMACVIGDQHQSVARSLERFIDTPAFAYLPDYRREDINHWLRIVRDDYAYYLHDCSYMSPYSKDSE